MLAGQRASAQTPASALQQRYLRPGYIPPRYKPLAQFVDQSDGFGLRFRQYERFNVGMNYWPMPQIVFKIDGQWESANGPVRTALDGFNLGLGYQF